MFSENRSVLIKDLALVLTKFKVGVLHPVQQPGSYLDRSSELPLVGREPKGDSP